MNNAAVIENVIVCVNQIFYQTYKDVGFNKKTCSSFIYMQHVTENIRSQKVLYILILIKCLLLLIKR